jgi:hypothetical protein
MKCSVPFAILLEITANLYVHRRRQHRQYRQPTGGAGNRVLIDNRALTAEKRPKWAA